MNCSYDDILNALLKEYESNPQANVNTLAQSVAKMLDLKLNENKLEQVNALIDSFNDSYNNLIEEKERNGSTTEAWMRKRLSSIAADQGLNEEEQVEMIELVADTLEENNKETIINID